MEGAGGAGGTTGSGMEKQQQQQQQQQQGGGGGGDYPRRPFPAGPPPEAEILLRVLHTVSNVGFREELSSVLATGKSVHDDLLPALANAPFVVPSGGGGGGGGGGEGPRRRYIASHEVRAPIGQPCVSRLRMACVHGRIDRVRALLAAGADPCGLPDAPSHGDAAVRFPHHPRHHPSMEAFAGGRGSLLYAVAESVEMQRLTPAVASELALLLLRAGACVGRTPGEFVSLLVVVSRVPRRLGGLFLSLLDRASYPPGSAVFDDVVLPAVRSGPASAAAMYLGLSTVSGPQSGCERCAARSAAAPAGGGSGGSAGRGIGREALSGDGGPEQQPLRLLRHFLDMGGCPDDVNAPADSALLSCLDLIVSRASGRGSGMCVVGEEDESAEERGGGEGDGGSMDGDGAQGPCRPCRLAVSTLRSLVAACGRTDPGALLRVRSERILHTPAEGLAVRGGTSILWFAVCARQPLIVRDVLDAVRAGREREGRGDCGADGRGVEDVAAGAPGSSISIMLSEALELPGFLPFEGFTRHNGFTPLEVARNQEEDFGTGVVRMLEEAAREAAADLAGGRGRGRGSAESS